MNALSMPGRRLISQDDAAMIENAAVPRSRFNNRWGLKTAFDAGLLVPILCEEILPGDHMTYDVTAYVRMATPLFPIFDNQRVDTFFFFVPNRLVWNNWVRFMGEQPNPSDSISFTLPKIGYSVPQAVGSLFDYFGIPVAGQHTNGQSIAINALPFRMYNLIYNTWFRDQNVMPPRPVSTGDGPDLPADYTLMRRAKSHDYFTSALPWPQKFTAPTIKLSGTAPVSGIGIDTTITPLLSSANVFDNALGTVSYSAYTTAAIAPNPRIRTKTGANATPDIYADLSQVAGIAINTLREAWMIQGLLERDARGGTRYTELIRSHFGVVNPDFRLTRPEYIGGGQTPLIITPVAQTAPTTGLTVGALGAAGTAAGSHRATYAATEHGFIIGLVNVRTELTYQQGLHRMWTRTTRYDYYWPALAGLGEQAIKRGELYFTGSVANDDAVFGYQERWHEYRTHVSEATGIMRSTATGTLDMWHLGQRFLSAPVLDKAFLDDTPPMSRVLAAGSNADGQHYLADIEFRRTAVRPVPMYGTPQPIGRF